MTDKQVDHIAVRNAKFNRDLQTVYDREGKLAAIRDYRGHYACGLKEAKDAVEKLFPYSSRAFEDQRTW
jgi:ribosomal protein L7/L12